MKKFLRTGKKTSRTLLSLLAVQVLTAAISAEAFADKPESVSPNGVKTLSPEGGIQSTGPWDLGARAGDYVYVAGMRGIDPATNKLVADEEGRIRQAFMNMKLVAESEGASLQDATRLVVYVTDMYRYRPIVNKVQEELWGKGPYPPRTIIEVDRLNQDDIVEVEGTFYAPEKEAAAKKDSKVSANGVKTLSPEGGIQSTGPWDLGARAGDTVYVAGMRGIDPATNTLVADEEGRIRQAFMNMKLVAESEGASLQDATRLVVYVTDMYRYRPIVNKVQEELWGGGPYPPRTIIEVDRLNQDDIVEVEGTFHAPVKGSK
jgi:enamine deaminase RidA (YjgF/YER057c/UK114 family)